MKSNMKLHLENLGFKSLEEKKTLNKSKSTNICYFKATKIVKEFHNKPDKWQEAEFALAIIKLTNENIIMSKDVATKVFIKWRNNENRIYEKDYSIALLMLTGTWISPKRKPKKPKKAKKKISKWSSKAAINNFKSNANYKYTNIYKN